MRLLGGKMTADQIGEKGRVGDFIEGPLQSFRPAVRKKESAFVQAHRVAADG